MEVTTSPQLLRQTQYRFYAACLLYPNPLRTEQLRSGATLLRLLGGAAPERQLIEWIEGRDDDLERSQGEWTRLFGASRTDFCQPYEGAQVPAEAAGALLAHLQRTYAAAGVALASDELPDFVSVQLEFLSHLCGIERAAIEGSNSERAARARRARLAFLRRHTCRWLPQLAGRVREKEGGPYAAACAAAAELAERDRVELSRQLGEGATEKPQPRAHDQQLGGGGG